MFLRESSVHVGDRVTCPPPVVVPSCPHVVVHVRATCMMDARVTNIARSAQPSAYLHIYFCFLMGGVGVVTYLWQTNRELRLQYLA